MPRKKVDASNRRRVVSACGACKRRKERCNGSLPCARCIERRVDSSCTFDDRAPQTRWKSNISNDLSMPLSLQEWPSNDSSILTGSPRAVHHHSRLIQDAKGKHMFIGDSANLSFLQIIRQLVSVSLGPCAFVNDPMKSLMVEPSPIGEPAWLCDAAREKPPQLDHTQAVYLVRRYILATCCVLDLFDESALLEGLQPWLDNQGRGDDAGAKYCLVLAIGAQTCPEDKDELATTLFNHGRYLTASSFMEDPSIATVQMYALITMYLLGACRRNAAFMYLGIAVRAAYALGLHRLEVAVLFSDAEFRTRERLWKAIRILDLFMSTSLGRPPSTTETRDTQSEENYSASTDLCAVFEQILNEVYSRRMISTAALTNISGHHRRWSARFVEGLQTDGIRSERELTDAGMPNIGLIHVKEAYYWTIILLTRPFLIEYVLSKNSPPEILRSEGTDGNPSETLTFACVDSAISTVRLLEVFLHHDDIPKRLPFVVNSIFVAALVLGLAHFGNLHKTLPLDKSLRTAHDLLARFPHDKIAERNLAIIKHLESACNLYREKTLLKSLAQCERLVTRIFGQIHNDTVVDGAGLDGWGQRLGSQQNDVQRETEIASNNNLFGDVDLDFSVQDMSPRTLWFDSFVDITPLFSTVDTTTFT